MSIILNKIRKEAIIYCPLCGKEYRPQNMKIVEQVGETIMAHSNCPTCEGAVLSLLFKDMLGITLVGMVTDLDYNDALRLKNKKIIANDEVLQFFELLNINN